MGKVLGLGEILWDIFGDTKFLGGAPTNFVFHCRQMGLEAWPVSRIGKDELGQEILGDLRKKNIPADLIQIDYQKPTGTTRVEMEGTGHRFTITEDVAWDYIMADEKSLSAARGASAICFGSLGQRNDISRSSIMKLIRECSGLVVFDINLRQHFYTRDIIEDSLEFSNVLKLNNDEILVLQEMLGIPGQKTEEICRGIMKEFDLDLVSVTRGAEGAMLVSEKDVADEPGRPVTVADTVGCGDAFCAVLVNGLLKKKELSVIAREACRVGEFVAGKTGATPEWGKEITIYD
jgi:fructokinase